MVEVACLGFAEPLGPSMPAHRIYFHLTWSTLGRRPMIDTPTGAFLDEYFRKIAVQERVTIVALGFLQTHVHLVVRTTRCTWVWRKPRATIEIGRAHV